MIAINRNELRGDHSDGLPKLGQRIQDFAKHEKEAIAKTISSPKLKAIAHDASIASRNSKLQFEIAIVLTAILPALSVAFMFTQGLIRVESLRWPQIFILSMLALVMVSGYALLSHYPRAIMKLRDYMHRVAKGEIPDSVHLVGQEDDITAIEKCFNLVLSDMRTRIDTIKQQQRTIIEGERNRVMLETIGTACHHLGQPATVISACIDIMKQEPLSERANLYLDTCTESVHQMRGIFEKLQKVNTYRTEAYCSLPNGMHRRIVQLDQEGAGDR